MIFSKYMRDIEPKKATDIMLCGADLSNCLLEFEIKFKNNKYCGNAWNASLSRVSRNFLYCISSGLFAKPHKLITFVSKIIFCNEILRVCISVELFYYNKIG